ncbi:MAG TPA: hypothetical protein VI233_00895 [Puia sp.]
MLKKKIYAWHRRLSLIIALPVVLSAGSGILHPVMTNIRPAVATQTLSPQPIDSSQIRCSLQAALDSSHIDTISQVRIVRIDTNWFYQVQSGATNVPVYLSARTGKVLPKGDYLYAQYIARQFLEGQPHRAERQERGGAGMAEPDCCNAATLAVVNARGSKVLDETRLEAFDEEYAEVNRLLPVYKVAFDRPDGMRIYVETVQDRFALAVDNRRASFNRVFQFIHTYQWLDFLGKGRPVAEFLLTGLAFVTTLLGICIFFTTRSKKVPGNEYVGARRNHRYTAIVISLFTGMFSFSGAYHALTKLKDDRRLEYYADNRIASNSIRFAFDSLSRAARRPITGVSLVEIGGTMYWQLSAKASERVYLSTADYSVLADGERKYARHLATLFSGQRESSITSVTQTTKFDRYYNFSQKRLPVWCVAYPVNNHERYYVETSSGRLSTRVDDMDLLESYSFALFHKHEFLAALGKPVKDASTMFWAAAQLFLVSLGLILFFKAGKRKKSSTAPAIPCDAR